MSEDVGYKQVLTRKDLFGIAVGMIIFATLSSDEFKKTAAAKKNLCGCRSNWRLEAKKSPVVPGK